MTTRSGGLLHHYAALNHARSRCGAPSDLATGKRHRAAVVGDACRGASGSG
jgi:hypothetical protein